MDTSEQVESHAGLHAQRKAILRECERNGWHLVEVVEDAGYSAKDLARPGIRVALETLEAGTPQALVVARLARLSRSMLDFASVMTCAQRQGWGLVALDVNVDTPTPSGEMRANVMATFAQFERRLIGQRTKEALAARRQAGVQLGRRSTLPSEVRERIRAQRSEGLSLARIATGLNSDAIPTGQGGKQWRASSVRAVLQATSRS